MDEPAAGRVARPRAACRGARRPGRLDLRRQGVGPLGRQPADRAATSGRSSRSTTPSTAPASTTRARAARPTPSCGCRHGPRRDRDPGHLRADLSDLDRRPGAARGVLWRLQRLAAGILQRRAGSADRRADAAGKPGPARWPSCGACSRRAACGRSI